MTDTLFTRDGTERKPNGADEKGNPIFCTTQSCSRCGGLGGSDKWGPAGSNTGWTCHRCNGRKTDPNPLILKLYTATKLAKLVAAQAKRDATMAAKKAVRDAEEAARVERERNDCLAAHADILMRIRSTVPDQVEGNGFFASIIDQVENRARYLSDKQVIAAVTALDKIDAERARLARADYVGIVGERTELTLTLKKVISLGDRFRPFYICIFETETGSKVLYKGSTYTSVGIDLVYNKDDREWEFPKTLTVRLKAKIKAHGRSQYNGEPETVIERAKVLEAA